MGKLARREFLGGAAALGLTACRVSDPAGNSAEPKGKTGVSADLLGKFADQILAEYPENATALGIDKGARAPLKHRLTDRSPAGRARLAAAARARLAVLKSADLSDLSAPNVLDAANGARNQRRGLSFPVRRRRHPR